MNMIREMVRLVLYNIKRLLVTCLIVVHMVVMLMILRLNTELVDRIICVCPVAVVML